MTRVHLGSATADHHRANTLELRGSTDTDSCCRFPYYRRGSRPNIDAVEFATLGWVDWFNTRRLLEPTGYIPPAECAERYYE